MRLLTYSWRLSPVAVGVAIVLGIAGGLLQGLTPLFIGQIVGSLASATSVTAGQVAPLLGALAAQALLGPIMAWQQTRLLGLTSRDQLLRLGSLGAAGPDVSTIEDSAFRAKVSFARSRLHTLDEALQFTWSGLIPNLIALVLMSTLIAVLHSLIAAVILTVAVILDAWWTTRAVGKESEGWNDIADASSRAEYAASVAMSSTAAKESRIFAATPYLRNLYLKSIETVHRRFRSARRKNLTGLLTFSVIRVTAICAIVIWVSLDTYAQRISIGTLAGLVPIVVGFATIDLAPIRLLRQGDLALKLLQETSALPVQGARTLPRQWPQRIDEKRIDETQRIDETCRNLDREVSPPSIRFERVAFTYPGSPNPVFIDLTFHLESGRAYALVGPNGAGKSTIVKLLTGAYRPSRGQIIVDDQDTSSWSERDWAIWQKRFACVLQDIPMLPIAVGDYVEFGASQFWTTARGEPSDTHLLERAAARSGLEGVVSRLPNGWATSASSSVTGGADFSGGEWQRLALAQAVRSVDEGAGVFVLDEPAAALDVEAEAALVHDYLNLVAGTTSLVISHRFSVVRPVPNILVLGRHGIEESGSHKNLIHRNGRYAAMFRSQSSTYLSSSPDGPTS